MSVSRWVYFILVIVAGLVLGLLYGWVISPVKYVDTTPATLRADFKADFSLMVAETYQHDGNLENAAQYLGILGNQPPAQFVSEAIGFAKQNNFYQEDIDLLQNLNSAFKSWKQPGGGQP
jgi:hypothetical protein